MKNFLLFVLLMMSVSSFGQEMNKDSVVAAIVRTGVYEVKEVVNTDSVGKDMLFGRAMEAFSDWAGDDGMSKALIDYSDKDAGTVIYKGRLYQGYYKTSLGAPISYYLNFTMKVRCKDDRAQVGVSVGTVTVEGYRIPPKTVSVKDMVQVKQSELNDRQKKRNHVRPMSECVKGLVEAMKEKLMDGGDDDF